MNWSVAVGSMSVSASVSDTECGSNDRRKDDRRFWQDIVDWDAPLLQSALSLASISTRRWASGTIITESSLRKGNGNSINGVSRAVEGAESGSGVSHWIEA